MPLIFYYDKDLPKPTPPRAEYLKNQVQYLAGQFQPEQRTPEWYEMRNTMLTASDWGTILGENHYSSGDSVLLKKCGDTDNFVYNDAMKWGNKYESVAVLIYEYRNQKKILEFGCLKHPTFSFLGASPDGITTEGIMLEIKCPSSREITGIPPSYYWCQVQGQLEVCELDRCDFLECRIKEYQGGEKEYLEDNYEGNYLMNSHGGEKGLVAEFFKKEDNSFYFEYSPVCLLGKELEDWKAMIIEKNKKEGIFFSVFYYWYLEQVSCVPIYRNQEWFHKARIELEDFWNEVLKYRSLGLAQLKEDLKEIKDNKKRVKEEKREAKAKKTPPKKKDTKKKDYIYLDMNTVFLDDDKQTENKNTSEVDLLDCDEEMFDTKFTGFAFSEEDKMVIEEDTYKPTIGFSMFSD
jgi:putative phage-type endonuclease